MQKIAVKVKKLSHFRGELPSYGSAFASGFDLRARIDAPLILSPGSDWTAVFPRLPYLAQRPRRPDLVGDYS